MEGVSVQQFTAAGKTFFISLRRKPDLQGGSVDLAVTDGAAAWTAAGVRCADLIAQPIGDELNHFIAALSSDLAAESTPQAKYTIDARAAGPSRDGLDLAVSWVSLTATGGVKATAALQPAVPAGPVVAGMLELLVANVAAVNSLKHSAEQMRQEWLEKVEVNQGLVAEYVEAKVAHEAELHVKMAALLNSKKIKLREMLEENRKLRQEVQQLQLGRGGVEAAPAASEAAGAAAGGAGAAAAAALAPAPAVLGDEASAMAVDGEQGEGGAGPPAAPPAPESAPQQQQQHRGGGSGGGGGGDGGGNGGGADSKEVESEVDEDEDRDSEDLDYHTDQ